MQDFSLNGSVAVVDFSLDGSVAVVTGSARGIGKAIAFTLARAGAKVALVDMNKEAVEASAKEIEEACGVECVPFVADLSSEEQIEPLFSSILEKFSQIDILVNNAGITRDNLLIRMKDSDWQKVIDVNLKSVFLCTRAVFKSMMKQRHGKIINIASIVGLMGNAGQANYCASKAGVIGFSKAVAREGAARSINVNVIAPGFIATDMTENLPESAKQSMLAQTPLGRMGKAQDVANAVLFFASPAADFLTGQVLCVDGGLAM
ncbi:3-oxoacyl-[bacterium]|nr:3-oxoacyl-[acyl-carrier-protein] reductase [bacterium]